MKVHGLSSNTDATARVRAAAVVTLLILFASNVLADPVALPRGPDGPGGTPMTPITDPSVVFSGGKHGALGDRVWVDADGDGVQSAGEPGMSGVRVDLFDCAGMFERSAFTNAAGNYRFDGLAPGCYRLRFEDVHGYRYGAAAMGVNLSAPALLDPATRWVSDIQLGDAQSSKDFDAGLVPLASSHVGDRVWEDLDGDGVQDMGEPGIQGVTVKLYNCADDLLDSVLTHDMGVYEFPGLAEGCYFVEFLSPQGYARTAADQGSDTADSDANEVTGQSADTILGILQSDFGIDAGLYRPVSLGDRVWHDVNRDGVQNAGEPGVPGVTVVLLDDTGAPTGQTALTAADGSFEFNGLRPGGYMVQFVLPPGYFATANDSAADNVDSDVNSLGRTAPVQLRSGDASADVDMGVVLPLAIDIAVEKSTQGFDADVPTGPYVNVGYNVLWEYVVTNTGAGTLFNVSVTDNQGIAVSCPQTVLEVNETMTCTAVGSAQAGQQQSTGEACADDSAAAPLTQVCSQDTTHFFGAMPAVLIDKKTNGVSANFPPGPSIVVGDPVTWRYKIRNVGNVTLTNIQVIDDQGVTVTCPTDTLPPSSGTSGIMACFGFGTAMPGQYANVGTVIAEGPNGTVVSDKNDSHYFGVGPGIDIEKSTNGVDADDPNAGDAPQIAPGDPVTWTYVVTNTGNLTLTNVTVTDDQGVAVSCPQTTLAPNEVMVCTASGIAEDLNNTTFTTVPGVCTPGTPPLTPLYENMGMATGEFAPGDTVNDTDPSHYCNPPEPGIDIEKSTNGVDADDPNAGDAPQIAPGDTVTWTYVVTNTGSVPLTNVVVNDDQIGAISCPTTTLAPGDSMTCTATGIAEDVNTTAFTTEPGLCSPGFPPNTPLYANMGDVVGTTPGGGTVTDVDPSHYCNPPEPGIDIEKSTNGVDADDPNAGDAPQIAPGDTVTWTYVVTNTGSVPLTNVVVNDDQIGAISCPTTTLAPGDSMTCTATGIAEDVNTTAFTTEPGLCSPGFPPNTPLYANMGDVVGTTPGGGTVTDIDPSHYCNPPEPGIDIEKLTNGVDADDPNAGDAPQIAPGDTVTWTYIVTNTGGVELTNVIVTDDQIGQVCTIAVLPPGDSENCVATGIAEDVNTTAFTTEPGLCSPGFPPNTPLYANMGDVVGTTPGGGTVTDIDPSHYCNPPMPDIAIEKLTNGVDADDPNAGDAPQISPGDVVTWSYVVTNAGNVTLTNVTVDDDQIGPINCPMTTLAPGDSMTCTATGIAEDVTNTAFATVPGLCSPGLPPPTPLYTNMGLATGEWIQGQVIDTDPSHYCNPPEPAIDIEKLTNGVQADDPNAGDAPQIMPGDTVTWTYIVTNTGPVTLTNVTVTDDQIGPITCPTNTLAPGDSMFCTAMGIAEDVDTTAFTTVPGLCSPGFPPGTPLYANMGDVVGTAPNGSTVTDVDPSHYCNPPNPDIDIEKLTNGVQADDPNAGDAPIISPGDVVTWTYIVTNTGDIILTDVTVVDDQIGSITCPTTTLAPNEQMLCTAMGVADNLFNTTFATVPGVCGPGSPPNIPLYENMGTATGEWLEGMTVDDTDPSHYCNPPNPDIDIEKLTNGVQADDPNAGDAPQVAPGDTVTWSYIVTNTGDTTLTNVTVTDDQIGPITCPLTTLAPMQQMTCTATGIAEDVDTTAFTTEPGLCSPGFPPGTPLYANMGDVVGTAPDGSNVTDVDPSHYCNPPNPAIDIEKLTNGVQADDPNAGDAPQILPGDTVTWTYIVTNTGDVALDNVTVDDDQIGAITCPTTTLAPGASMTCTATGIAEDVTNTTFATVPGLCTPGLPPGTPLYENMGMATGEWIPGQTVNDVDPSHYCNPPPCSLSVDKSCLIPVAPPGVWECTKPIDTLTMIYDGATPVRIKAWKGNVGSTLLADIDDIQPGEEVSVMGFAGSPNDVIWEVFDAGTSNKIGESKFHLSCSDSEMDGPEDCGMLEGNGKGNDSSLLNVWLLEGIIDAGGELDCTQPPAGPGNNTCEFQAFPASCDTTNADFLTFQYTGGGCAASDNDQQDHTCSGSVNGGAAATFTDDDGNSVTLNPGDTVTIPRNFAKNMTLTNGGGTETNVLHTSCSQPLVAGDVYGSLTLALVDGMGIGTDVDYIYTVTNTSGVDITSLSVIDNVLGPVPGAPSSLAAGDTVTLTASSFLTQTTTNTVIVDGDTADGSMCNATADATVTILPPPPCEVDGLGVLDLSSDKVKWELTNNGAFNATIESVQISWPASNGDIIEVKIDGDKIWEGNRSPTSTTFLPGDWINDPAKRIIPPGDTDVLEIKFANDVSLIQGDYSITVNFEEGCSVTYVNTGLPFECNTDITELTMIWDGAADPIQVKAWKGNVGSTLLLDQSGIGVGDEVVVSGYAGSPNDVIWEVFSGASKIGESKFHLSCSDNEMNGAEDCGNRQGNGKGNDSGLINDWLLEGMVDADGPFDCSALP